MKKSTIKDLKAIYKRYGISYKHDIADMEDHWYDPDQLLQDIKKSKLIKFTEHDDPYDTLWYIYDEIDKQEIANTKITPSFTLDV